MIEPNFRKTCTFLRRTTDEFRWGHKVDGIPKPRAAHVFLTNEINDFYDKCRQKSSRIVAPKKIDNARFLKHFNREDSLYFYGITSGIHGDGSPKINAKSLVMFDVDCHDKDNGDPRAFVQWLAKRMPWFSDAYQEGSNRGWHAYGVLDAEGMSNGRICRLYNRMNSLMHREKSRFAQIHGNIISGAEVKGRPCELSHKNGKSEIKTGGTLALYPRNPSYFPSCPIKDEGEFGEVLQNCVVISESMIQEWEERLDREDRVAISVKFVIKTEKKIRQVGSCTDHPIPNCESYSDYLYISNNLLPQSLPCVGGRHVATAIDLGIFLMILKYCRPYHDGSMPMNSIRAIWEKLYSEGKIPRGWNPNRYVALRNFLTDSGLIVFQDVTYTPPSYKTTNGERIRDQQGLACKWSITEGLRVALGKKNKRPEDTQIGLNTKPLGLIDRDGNRSWVPPKPGPRPRYVSRAKRFLGTA